MYAQLILLIIKTISFNLMLFSIIYYWFPEMYSPSVVKLWRLYYKDDDFYLFDKHHYHHYDTPNSIMTDIWMFKFSNKPQCTIALYRKPNGNFESMIVDSETNEVYMHSDRYKTIGKKMTKKLMPFI